MKLIPALSLVSTLWVAQAVEDAAPETDSQKARSLVAQTTWGVVSFLDSDGTPKGEIHSLADSDGRIFMYLMGKQEDDIALTLTRASLPPFKNLKDAACGTDGNWDAQDPRCAKMTVSGSLEACDKDKDEGCKAGWVALTERHPTMSSWPVDHDFIVHELKISDIWMIANYGGQSIISPESYYKAQITTPVPAVASSGEANVVIFEQVDYPKWDQKAERARWIIGNALWTTLSTVSVRLEGKAWGNLRSIADGPSASESTGKPVFYLPKPDSSMKDVTANPKISITVSEASLYGRLSHTGGLCGKEGGDGDGNDPEYPMCARVYLTGTAKELSGNSTLKAIKAAFKARHPLAPWLSEGGSHTGGAFFTIDLEKVAILDYFGGATDVDVEEYLLVVNTDVYSS